jgi:hypothetical protein
MKDLIPSNEYFFTKKYWGVMFLLGGLGGMFVNSLFSNQGLLAILVFVVGLWLITR